MVFKKNFVVAIKVDGKVLREIDGVVRLPFGSEYSILLKNLDSRRASIGIEIDGEDVLGGNRVVIKPNSSHEHEGFMEGNRTKYKFKFIEKTNEISSYRGDKIEDGLIRVDIRFEKPAISWSFYTVRDLPLYSRPPVYGSYSNNAMLTSWFTNDCGTTVGGADSNQTFSTTTFGDYEDETVICIALKGTKQDKPIYTTSRIRCHICGKYNKSLNKFCSNCGARLVR